MDNVVREKIQSINFIYKIILYTLFAVLWSISNVGYSFGLMTWFVLVPFLFFVRYEKMKNSLWYSLYFGFIAYLVHQWWMIIPVTNVLGNGSFPLLVSIFAMFIGVFLTLALSVFHGFSYLLIVFLSRFISRKRVRLFYFVIPLVFTVVDFYYPKLWADQIGYSQYVFYHYSQIADIFGVPFMTLMIISFNCAILLVIESIITKKKIIISHIILSVLIVMIVLSSVYGLKRVKYIKQVENESEKVTVGVVQGNISGLDKKSKSYDEINDTYNRVTRSIMDEDPDLIVWPESAIYSWFSEDIVNYSNVIDFGRVPLLFGTHTVKSVKADDDPRLLRNRKPRMYSDIYNSLVLLDRNHQKLDAYYKIRLLPFVEAAPFRFLKFVMDIIGFNEFSKGEQKILKLDNMKIAANICYEAIFPDFIRRSIEVDGEKANILVNATNDSWFGKTIEPNMHLHIAGFRSIENRLAMIRSTCTGHSVVFDATGGILNKSDLFVEEAFSSTVSLVEIDTIYKNGGWFFIYVLLYVLIVILLFVYIRRTYFRYIMGKAIRKIHHKKSLEKMWLE